MNRLRGLQEQFRSCDGDLDSLADLGERLRSVGRRAMELVDEAFLNQWRQSSSCQVESSSLTIKIPSQISV